MNQVKYQESQRTLYEVSGDITDHNTVLVNRAELRRLHEQNQKLLEALKDCVEAMTWELGGEPLDTLMLAARNKAREAIAEVEK